MKDWIRKLDNVKFGSGTYSQSYQDELLAIIFENIGTANSIPCCIEFGFNSMSLTGGSGANTTSLTLNHNWESLLLDGGHENPAINLHRHLLSSTNICEVFRKYNVPREPEYVSIDVDSTDLWLFDALLKDYRAMVFSVEYNSHFPLDKAITFPNDPDQRYEGDRGYGASLNALNMVASEHGYSLLWVVPQLDAFFIRNDLVDDGTEAIVFPLEKWWCCTEIVHHKPLKREERAKTFIDYEIYMATGGDLELSTRSAYPICRKFLLDNFWQYPFRLMQRAFQRQGACYVNGTRFKDDGNRSPSR